MRKQDCNKTLFSVASFLLTKYKTLLLLLRPRAHQSVFESVASTCQYPLIIPQQLNPTRSPHLALSDLPQHAKPDDDCLVPAEARLWASFNQTISQTRSEQVSIGHPSLEISRCTKKSLIQDKGWADTRIWFASSCAGGLTCESISRQRRPAKSGSFPSAMPRSTDVNLDWVWCPLGAMPSPTVHASGPRIGIELGTSSNLSR